MITGLPVSPLAGTDGLTRLDTSVRPSSHIRGIWYPMRALTVFTDLACMSLDAPGLKYRARKHPATAQDHRT